MTAVSCLQQGRGRCDTAAMCGRVSDGPSHFWRDKLKLYRIDNTGHKLAGGSLRPPVPSIAGQIFHVAIDYPAMVHVSETRRLLDNSPAVPDCQWSSELPGHAPVMRHIEDECNTLKVEFDIQ